MIAALRRLACLHADDQAESVGKVYPSARHRMTITSATWIKPEVIKMAIVAASYHRVGGVWAIMVNAPLIRHVAGLREPVNHVVPTAR